MRTPLVSGANDVGDVVLGEAPLLVAGRVVGSDGKPVDPAPVSVERTRVGSRTERWEQAWDLRPNHLGPETFYLINRER